MDWIYLSNSFSILNWIFISLFNIHFLILSFIKFIFLILSSILIQSFISELNLLSSFHSLFISSPFSNDNLILFGNFYLSFIISSLLNILLYLLSTSNNNASSLSFKAVLIWVKIFWIFAFNSSLFSLILLNNIFNSLIELSTLFDKSSKYLI